MTSSSPPTPYPLSIPSSTPPSTMRLLVPMPIPRTPNAPYFDERRVRDFLALILQHGSNAGITDADELVTFIVRYSSDRVREVIQYIPELDDDEPGRTWSAAKEQMLLLYGCLDDERLVSEQDLIEFCREQSAKCPYCNKLEVEQYLRSFQSIAGPLVKMQEITTAKRDFYFVSGIPSSIKNWFIERVPESQRKRSNPIPLADSVGILYDYFDPDTLFPGLWSDIDNKSEPRSTSPPPVPHAQISSHITSLPPAPICLDIPSSSTTISATAQFALDTPGPLKTEDIASPLDRINYSRKDSSTEETALEVPPSAIDYVPPEADTSSTDDYVKVPPSDEIPENVVCRVDFGPGKPHIIDRRYEPVDTFAFSMEILHEVNNELERYLACGAVNYDESQISSIYPCSDHDSGTITESDVESIFDLVPDPEIHTWDSDSLSSCSLRGDFDHGFDTGTEFLEYCPPRDVQATELDILSGDSLGRLPAISDEVNNELERYLATGESEFDVQASLNFSFVDRDSASATGNEIETIFDSASEYQAETEPDLYAWSSSFPPADSDHNLEQGTDLCPHFPPCNTEAIELDTPPCDTDSTSINDAHHIQHDLRKPFIFPEPSTEQLSNHEPFTRAESFFSCASYVDYFVPELFESDTEFCISRDRVLESIVPMECPEPEDDPPSYQESISLSPPSPEHLRHGNKAEYIQNIVLYIAACWQFVFSALCGFALGFYGVSRSHGQSNTVRDSEHATEREEDPDISEDEFAELEVLDRKATDFCGQDTIEILADVVPPDKSFHSFQNIDSFHFTEYIYSPGENDDFAGFQGRNPKYPPLWKYDSPSSSPSGLGPVARADQTR